MKSDELRFQIHFEKFEEIKSLKNNGDFLTKLLKCYFLETFKKMMIGIGLFESQSWSKI